MKILVGLMGVGNNGMLYHPDGHKLFWMPMRIACIIQRIQHYFAQDMNGNKIRPSRK